MTKQALALVAALTIAVPAAAQNKDLTARVEATLAQLAGPGTRFGIVVVDDQGKDVVAINPDARFIPASNTKMFTTATALDTMGDLSQPDTTGGAAVRLDGRDVVLIGCRRLYDRLPDDARRCGREKDADSRRRDRRRHAVARRAMGPGDELEQHPDAIGHRHLGLDDGRQ